MRFSFRALRLPNLAVLGLGLALSACQLPSPIPSGYVHHSKPYKSPPARAPEDIGIPWSPAANEEATAHWRVAARDLADRIAADLPNGEAHLVPAAPDDPLSTLFENYLREALQDRSVILERTRAAAWPDLAFDTAIVTDNPKRAQWLLGTRPVASNRQPVNETTPPPAVPVAPVVVLDGTGSDAPLDLPPQSLTAPVPTPKPIVAPSLGMGPDRVAIRVDRYDRGLPAGNWSGTYPVPGIDSYRYPHPHLRVLRPVVGERPAGGTMPPMEVNR